jgi:zinc D-Ala-D-Ala carboxypeptidase
LNPLPAALAALHRELGVPAGYALERQLAPYPEADEAQLVTVGVNDEGRSIHLVRPAAYAWAGMRDAAKREDVELLPISGFRSVARQAELIRDKLAGGQSLADVLRYVAAPGFSEHHTGRALDIGSPEHIELDEEFAGTAAFRWLERNAGRFGYSLSFQRGNPHGIGYEPWHWCWHPRS